MLISLLTNLIHFANSNFSLLRLIALFSSTPSCFLPFLRAPLPARSLPGHIGSDTTAARPPRGGRRWCHCDAPIGGFGYRLFWCSITKRLPGCVESLWVHGRVCHLSWSISGARLFAAGGDGPAFAGSLLAKPSHCKSFQLDTQPRRSWSPMAGARRLLQRWAMSRSCLTMPRSNQSRYASLAYFPH